MSIEWDVVQLERNASDGGVTVVHWMASNKEDNYFVKQVGTCTLSPDASESTFVAFEKLTKETVINWVKENIDVKTIEESLDSRMLELKSPTVITGTPWSM